MTRHRTIWLGCAALAIGSAALAGTGDAAAAPSPCDPYTIGPSHLRIQGRLADPESFAAIFHIASHEDGRTPQFQPAADLRSDAGAPPIPASAITVTNPAAPLTRNGSALIRVAVGGVRYRGVYQGQIVLAGAPKCSVSLAVEAVGAPKLAWLDEKVRLAVIRCSNLTCGPGDSIGQLMSSQLRRTSVTPRVDNEGQADAVVTAINVALTGDPGEGTIPAQAIVAENQNLLLPAHEITALPLKLDRSNLRPDHYTGTVSLSLAGEPDRTQLPISLDVKDGPLAAILLAILALAIQGLYLLWRGNQPRADALAGWRKLRQKTAPLGSDAHLFDARLNAVRDLIVAGELEAVASPSSSITTDIQRTIAARELEASAKRRTAPEPVGVGIRQLLAAFRQAIRTGESGTANSKLTDLRNAVDALPPDPGEQSTSLSGIVQKTLAQAVSASGLEAGVDLPTASNVMARAKAVIVWIWRHVQAGVTAMRNLVRRVKWNAAYAWLWFVTKPTPWLLGFVLTGVLLIVALKLYLGNPTFGSDRWDYAAFFAAALGGTGVTIALDTLWPAAKQA